MRTLLDTLGDTSAKRLESVNAACKKTEAEAAERAVPRLPEVAVLRYQLVSVNTPAEPD
jgi:hypothetical protein